MSAKCLDFSRIRIFNAACLAARTEDDLRVLDATPGCDAVLTKTATLEPILEDPENPPYYFADRDGGAVNRIGLVNPGYAEFAAVEGIRKPYIISVAGTLDELCEIVGMETNADALEFNISCPNVDHPDGLILEDLRKIPHRLPYGVKLPPIMREQDFIYAVGTLTTLRRETPLQYIVCCNTFKGVLEGRVGGISGKYLRPLALWNVNRFAHYLGADSPILIYGSGGVDCKTGVVDYLIEGAHGVQVGTALIEQGPEIFTSLRLGSSL